MRLIGPSEAPTSHGERDNDMEDAATEEVAKTVLGLKSSPSCQGSYHPRKRWAVRGRNLQYPEVQEKWYCRSKRSRGNNAQGGAGIGARLRGRRSHLATRTGKVLKHSRKLKATGRMDMGEVLGGKGNSEADSTGEWSLPRRAKWPNIGCVVGDSQMRRTKLGNSHTRAHGALVGRTWWPHGRRHVAWWSGAKTTKWWTITWRPCVAPKWDLCAWTCMQREGQMKCRPFVRLVIVHVKGQVERTIWRHLARWDTCGLASGAK
ncbi:hypothetical protein GH714_020798 [Hevea brasiliensis]|uniref:Uncharacterized protein n=1 Tax=Hevea brasiliensis TaxID=3981 RepID=A0A6A6LF18_HEVBR|nr:hypothetical protein GH714_020798 [Hevea brasiliensis]